MTIKTKILSVLGLIILLTGAAIGTAVMELTTQGPKLVKTESEVSAVLNSAIPLLVAIKNSEADVIQVQGWLTDIAATRGLPGFDDGFTEAENFANKFKADLKTAQENAKALNMPEILKSLKELQAAFGPFYTGGKKMAQAYIDFGPKGGNVQMGEFDVDAERMGKASANLVILVESKTAANLENLLALTSNIRKNNETLASQLIILAVIAAIITVVGVVYIYTTLTKNFYDLNRDLKVVMADDSTDVLYLNPKRKDEFGPVAAALLLFSKSKTEMKRMAQEQEEHEVRMLEEKRQQMLEMADSFDSSVGGIVQSVSSAATELQTSAESMSSISKSSLDKSTTVATASEEASTNVQTVASASEELSSSIQEISRQVAQSTQIAGSAVIEVESTNEKILGLANAANKIGEVVAMITDIADQTNLLALNATIEAARAGDAGKGFAVVASEVKNLANQTAKATEEISAQISGVQGATQEAVTAIGSIGGTINQLNEISSAIAAAVEEQGAATQEIARNVEQAANGTAEVSSNIYGVQQAAKETGDSSSDMLGAATELSQQSKLLRREVDTFLSNIRNG